MTAQYSSKSVLDTLQSHVSIREFIDKPIPDELLHTILNAARRSPTSSNMQAYSLVVVKDKDKLKTIAKLAGNQKFIETCGAFVAICADIHRLEHAANLHGQHLARNLENSLVATIDAALVGMSLSLTAESVGLGTTMIGGMRNYPLKAAEFFGLPEGVYVIFGLAMGWPDWERVKKQKPRLPEEVMIHYDKYSMHDIDEILKQYDNELKAHYEKEGRTTPDAAWTGIIAKRFSEKRRPTLRSELEELGFSFE